MSNIQTNLVMVSNVSRSTKEFRVYNSFVRLTQCDQMLD